MPRKGEGAAAVAAAPSTSPLAGLCLAVLLASLGTSIANVALPSLALVFDASFQEVQWVVLAYLLASTTAVVSVGRLGDLTGRRRLLIAGIALFTVASALCGLAFDLWTLVAARAAQGLGAAVMLALAMALASEAVPAERTASAMGLLGTMSAIGTALGPSLGGLLIAGLGWRAIFFVAVPLGAGAALLAYRHPARDQPMPASARGAFDNRGMLLLAVTLVAYTLAMTTGRGSFGVLNLALLAAALIGAGAFVLAQARTRSPLIRLTMLRSRRLSTGLVTSALVSTVMMTTLVVGPFYLTSALALDAAAVGLVMTTGPLVAALASVPAGRFADRIGAPRAARIGLAGIATGSLALAAIPAGLDIPGYVLPLVVLTAGYALFQTANNTNVMTNVHPGQRGLTSGMLNLSRNLGLITGASVMGAVFWFAAGTSDIKSATPESVATGMHITFLVAAALIFATLAGAALAGERAPRTQGDVEFGSPRARAARR